MSNIRKCRVCGSNLLKTVFDLGDQYLTGVFLKNRHINPITGPLKLVTCYGKDSCQLTQLSYSFPPDEMYGNDYGYNTSLNSGMVSHIEGLVADIENTIEIYDNECVLDIGSNDATLLSLYKNNKVKRFGIDPSAEKFKHLYKGFFLAIDFFSKKSINKNFGNDVVFKVVTAISMFYDLDNPVIFLKDVEKILDNNGMLVLEQSYLLSMIESNSFDTVCHEHVEYYTLKQIKYIARKAGLKVFNVTFSNANGGSFRVFLCKYSNNRLVNNSVYNCIVGEKEYYSNMDKYWSSFFDRIEVEKRRLFELIDDAIQKEKKVAILGASTKGNALLQYYNLTSDKIYAIGEINPIKFGRYTPGTYIKIVNEDSLLIDESIAFFIVLPWHFKDNFIHNHKYKGKTLVFPLPHVEKYIID